MHTMYVAIQGGVHRCTRPHPHVQSQVHGAPLRPLFAFHPVGIGRVERSRFGVAAYPDGGPGIFQHSRYPAIKCAGCIPFAVITQRGTAYAQVERGNSLILPGNQRRKLRVSSQPCVVAR